MYSCYFVVDLLTIWTWAYFWTLYSVSLSYVSVFRASTILFWLLYLCSIVSSQHDTFRFFFRKTALPIQSVFELHENFRIIFSSSMKMPLGIYRLLWVGLKKITIMILLTHVHSIVFHLFVLTSISFLSVL